jgi:hypothetical protein
VVELHEKHRRFVDALGWVDCGLALEQGEGHQCAPGFALPRMRRALLCRLCRGGEAVDAAWAECAATSSLFGYETLLREVPKKVAKTWHVKAFDLAETKSLPGFIEIATKTKEWDRLAGRVLAISQTELRDLSHFVAEPAADGLAKYHPGAAGRQFEAADLRTVGSKKSASYEAALRNFEHAKRCYEAAGESDRWAELVAAVRRDHSRKTGFMPGFEGIVRGDVREERSFLDVATQRWRTKTRGA